LPPGTRKRNHSVGGIVITAVSQSEIAAGTVLAEKYRVERLIGQGGMGVVVEARHVTLDDRVALKFLLPEYATHPEASERFLREARACVKIKSAHVARVSDVGTLESGAPYMVMEYLEGTDAAHVIAEGHRLAIPEAIDYVVQAGDAIAEAHSLGIVHRDVKPANMFVTRHTDGTPLVKLLDFGISKVVGDPKVDALTKTTATMGSALYMSPEQIKQSKSVDHRTDIYALGVSLYELLTGRQPFVADTFAALCVEIATGTPTPLAELRPDIPPELCAVIEKAYARDLSQRFQSVGEFVVALAPWAPPRSQPIIERIARAAGLVQQFASNPPPGDPRRGSYAHLDTGTGGALGAAGSQPGIAPAATNMSGSATVPPTTRSALGPILLVLGVLFVLGALGIGAVIGLKSLRSSPTAASAPVVDSAAPAATPVTTETAEPAVEPSVEPSASAAPEPTKQSPPAKAAPQATKPKATAAAKTRPPPTSKPAATQPAPTPTKPKTNAESYR
jgi:serine/threonine-protein kinase